MMTEDELARFMAFVYFEPNTGCWLHAGSPMGKKHAQYPGFQFRGKYAKAHRVSYAHFCGELLPGLVIDHKCRQRFCVNPQHLEQVTYKVNAQRGLLGDLRHLWVRPNPHPMSLRTHCPKGHEYTAENARINHRGSRECVTCTRDRQRELQRTRRAAEREARGGPKENGATVYRRQFTHCKNGHPYTHRNERQRLCRICQMEATRRYRARKNAAIE